METNMEITTDPSYDPPSPATSPIGSMYSEDMSDEELDRYFANYGPLSNLPTPPVPAEEREGAGDDGGECVWVEEASKYLANRVKPPAPHWSVRQLIERLRLSIEIIAFAACILDRVPNDVLGELPPTKSGFYVVAALAIAEDFVEDGWRKNSAWVAACPWGIQPESRQLNGAKLVLLKEINWELMKITGEMVEEKIRTRFKDGRVDEGASEEAGEADKPEISGHEKTMPVRLRGGAGERKEMVMVEQDEGSRERPPSMLKLDRQGRGVWLNGLQTPEPSP